MNILIVDDEPSWLSEAESLISHYLKERGIVPEIYTCPDPALVPKAVEDKLDLAFVDIVMDETDGISYVHHLNEIRKDCRIVYVTNYLNYAVDVYETAHVYFAVKEQFADRLPAILDKIEAEWVMGGALIGMKLVHGDLIQLRAEEIICFERELRKTHVRTTGGVFEVNDKLDCLLLQLPQPMFVRCHNSYIISLEHVRTMTSDTFTLTDGTLIPISRRLAAGVRKRFLEWSALRK